MLKSIWHDIVFQFRKGSVVIRIILSCIAVFLFFETIHLFYWACQNEAPYEHIYKWFALPFKLSRILTQPWSVVTFMFMHDGIGHILWNMLFLYWFGEIYQLYMRNRRVFPIFFFGSLVGAALAIILYHLLPPLKHEIALGTMVGASAGVQAIMFAATALNPEHKVKMLFIGYIPLKFIALASFLANYVAVSYGNAGGMIAHIGGALFGFFYIRSLQSGTDWFTPIDKIAALFKPKSKLKTSFVNNQMSGNNVKSNQSADEQKRVDAILDKIAKSGYNSLSKEEKDFLFKFSNK